MIGLTKLKKQKNKLNNFLFPIKRSMIMGGVMYLIADDFSLDMDNDNKKKRLSVFFYY